MKNFEPCLIRVIRLLKKALVYKLEQAPKHGQIFPRHDHRDKIKPSESPLVFCDFTAGCNKTVHLSDATDFLFSHECFQKTSYLVYFD